MGITQERSGTYDLLTGKISTTLLRFSLPFMLSTLLQTLYSTTDTIFIGQYLGEDGLAAVSTGSQLMQMLSMICIGFSTAGQILIAQAEGAKNKNKVQTVIGSLLILEVTLSIFLGLFFICFRHRLLVLLNTPQEAFDQASSYVLVCSAGLVFTGLYNMFSAILRGMGDGKHPLLFVVVASAINIVLDYLFLVRFHWDVTGTALATVIGQMASVLFSIVFLSRHSEQFAFTWNLRNLSPDRKSSVQIIKIGIPLAIQSAAIQFSFLFVSHMINTLGVSVCAAFGVAQKLRNLPGILTSGLGLAAGSMIGQNLGAARNDRVDQTIRWCLLYCTIINAVFGAFFFGFPVLCFRMFTQESAVLAYASICMLSLIIELPGKCVMPACNALVSAQGFVQFSMVVAFLDAFAGRVFFCWLLGIVLDLGALGFFLGYSAGTYLTAIPVLIYYISGLWKHRASLISNSSS
jgi:putative MATE family efflux protein